MRVKAKQFGFHGGQPREVGVEFNIPDHETLGSWMEKVETKPAKGGKVPGPNPVKAVEPEQDDGEVI